MQAVSVVHAPARWRTLEFISDIHLSASSPKTADLWFGYMRSCAADAVFILGDWFEVWVGDDDDCPFVRQCLQALQASIAKGVTVYFLHGNRDFLFGEHLAARLHLHVLADPSVLEFEDRRYLLTHGDLLCRGDSQYQQFRALVRSEKWQADFLAKPLPERRAIASHLRAQSQAIHSAKAVYADVDEGVALEWMHRHACPTMIHGHTHAPATHRLAQGCTRVVLSDWEASALPARAQILRLNAQGLQRIDVSHHGEGSDAV